ncbi:unnamed protein product, partial [marine sediment metagenome]
MKRLALAILVVTAVAATVFLALNRPGAEASPDFTITVDSTDDTDTRDWELTLREAMKLATGELLLGELKQGECNQVSGTSWEFPLGPCEAKHSPGGASADTIVFSGGDFPPGGSATIALSYSLPALDTGNDSVDGSATVVAVDGGWPSITPFDCFEITSDNNSIKGLEINGCWAGVDIRDGAQDNTIGGS